MTHNHLGRAGLSRDSFVAILMLVGFALAIACVAIVLHLQPDQYTTTALINVSADEVSFLSEPIPFDPRCDADLSETSRESSKPPTNDTDHLTYHSLLLLKWDKHCLGASLTPDSWEPHTLV